MQTLWIRVNAVLLLLVLLVMVGALANGAFGGPLDPPGPPGSTGKTQILSLPYTISAPGSYVLNGNLTGASGSNGITVSADNVTIDLNGFALIGPGGAANEVGIIGFVNNLTIRNGVVRDWGAYGIHVLGSLNTRLADLAIYHSGYINGGSAVLASGPTVITGITISDAYKGLQISGGEVSQCGITYTNIGIEANRSNIHHCAVNFNSGPYAVYLGEGSALRDSTVTDNSGDGVLLFAAGNTVEGNQIFGNGTSGGGWGGIHVASTAHGARVEGNNVTGNGVGIRVDAGGNVIINNSLNGNTTPYSIVAGNTVGDNTNVAGVVPSAPWANINY